MAKPGSKDSQSDRAQQSGGGSDYVRETLDPLDLYLDPENPRLAPADRGKSQSQLIEIMLQDFSIDEIAESICSAGFQPLDPFIGYQDKGKTYILEGNRRLATIKLLRKPELTPARFAKTWDAFRGRLRADCKDAMKKINVLVYDDRRDATVLSYVGFRHVNGVLAWKAEEKAAFIAKLVEDKNLRWSYDEVARKIGSKRPYVEKLYVAHRLIEQADEHEIPGTAKMRSAFGVLTRALQSPGVVTFLGVEFPNDPKKSANPCTKSARDLEDFVRWTFGTDDVKPVVEDSRDLTKWGY